MTLATGVTLASRYRLIRPLGEGGMGGVYLVEDLRDGGRWALKEVLDDASLPEDERQWARAHFDREIALMRRLSGHVGAARIPAWHDDFTIGPNRYLVMEYIPGDTLEARIEAAKGPLPERDTLRWMSAVLQTLDALHHRTPPIIVRDLKPGNIILTADGSARVIDFGIARTYKPGQASNTENLGTLAYASPEHHGHGQTDARSDIYSLGATMYHALTGREPQPFEAPLPGSLIRLNPALTPRTETLVARAMSLSPSVRFQTAAAMRAEVEAALAALPTPAAPARTPATHVVPRVAPKPARAPVTPTPAPRVCPRCGHANRPTARFCARDGAPLIPGVTVAPGAKPATPARARQPVSPAHVVASDGATHARRATDAFAQGRYQQTIVQGRQALERGHTTTDLLVTLARAYDHVGRPLEAAGAWERAAQIRPEPATLLGAAAAWRAAGRLTEAQVALSRARQSTPNDAEISYQLGVVNMALGHLAQAEGDLRDALTLEPGSPRVLTALGRLAIMRGAPDEALTPLRQAIASDNSYAEAHSELGRALLARRALPEAIKELEHARRLGADGADLLLALGMAYHATGRRQQAREALRQALAINPGDAEAQRLLRAL
ncbi:MAG TPA: tetratricopeptide repeat protein [Ktedonobacterales bacterium]|nr:tetratricopeptide repeat protein [Ktedonobacterales bacterium]